MKRTGPIIAMFCAILLLGTAIISSQIAPVAAQGIGSGNGSLSQPAPGGNPPAPSGDQSTPTADTSVPGGAPPAPQATQSPNAPLADTPSPTITNTPTGCTDVYEPDNLQSSPSTIYINQNQTHSFCRTAGSPGNDEDWIKISGIGAYGVYDIRTYALGSNADTIMGLIDAGGATIAYNDDETTGSRNSRIIYTSPTTATLYLQIVNKDSSGGFGPNWGYQVEVLLTGSVTPTPTPTITPTGGPSPTPFCTDVYEPDNNFDQSVLIQVGESQNHVLCNVGDPTLSGDVDYYKFSANSNVAYTISTKNLAIGTDTKIDLYNPSRRLIDSNDNCSGTGDLSSCLTAIFNSPGVYYFRVYDPRPGSGGVGHSYTVQLSGGAAGTGTPVPTTTASPTFTPIPTGTPCLDAFENDGVPEAAKLILVNTKQQRSFCPTGDADWVQFYAKTGKTYTIATGDLGAGLDTYLYLFDASLRAPIATNDDYGSSLASRIDFSPVVDGQYYVQIKNQGDVGSPDSSYSLSFLVVPGGVPATFPPTPPGGNTPLPTFTAQPIGTGQPTFTPSGLATVTATPGLPKPLPSETVTATPPASQPTTTATVNPPTVTATVGSFTEPTPPISTEPTPPLFPNTGYEFTPALVNVYIFVDRNGNGVADIGEGVNNVAVSFSLSDGTADAGLITNQDGTGGAVVFYAQHQLTIPYLGVIAELFSGVQRQPAQGGSGKLENWQLALPAPLLPPRVP